MSRSVISITLEIDAYITYKQIHYLFPKSSIIVTFDLISKQYKNVVNAVQRDVSGQHLERDEAVPHEEPNRGKERAAL